MKRLFISICIAKSLEVNIYYCNLPITLYEPGHKSLPEIVEACFGFEHLVKSSLKETLESRLSTICSTVEK